MERLFQNSRFLVIIAINLTVIALDRVVDRVIPDAMAASGIQRVAICDLENVNNCAFVGVDGWGGSLHVFN